MFEELSLQTVAPCRGCQILPCQSGTHVGCQRMLTESAAGAQAGPHACKHTHTRTEVTHTHMHEPASSNARDVHMLSNKLRPNDEQRMTCELRLHAQQYNGYYVNTFIPSVHEQSDCSESRMCWDIRSRSCWNFQQVNKSRWCFSENSMQRLPSSMNHCQKDVIFHNNHFQAFFSCTCGVIKPQLSAAVAGSIIQEHKLVKFQHV